MIYFGRLTRLLVAWPRSYVYEWLGLLIGFFTNEKTAIENYFWLKNTFYPPSWAYVDDIREQFRVRFAIKVHKLTLEDRDWFMGNTLQRIIFTFPELRRVDLELPAGGITGQHFGDLINAQAGGFDLADIHDLRQLESNHLLDAFEQILDFAPNLRKVKIIVVLPTLERIDSYHPGFPDYLRALEEEFSDAIDERRG